ncbi:MAG: ABC transporter permease [Candidatus Nanopelagicus sp.]
MRTKTAERKVSQIGFKYVVEARVLNMIKWTRIIIFVAISNPILYLLSIGIGVGSLIDSKDGLGGVEYLTFLAPALLATAAIQGMLDEVIFPTFEGFKWVKNFFAMNSTSLTGTDIAGGVFVAALLRTTFTVVIYWIALYFFGVLDSPTAWLAIPAAIFAGASFGALIMALAARAKNEDVFMLITGRFIVMPMFLFSGTFYPLELMPTFLQWIGWISPLWHATDLGRFLTYGHQISTTTLIFHLIYILALLIVGLYFAFSNYTKRLAK